MTPTFLSKYESVSKVNAENKGAEKKTGAQLPQNYICCFGVARDHLNDFRGAVLMLKDIIPIKLFHCCVLVLHCGELYEKLTLAGSDVHGDKQPVQYNCLCKVGR